MTVIMPDKSFHALQQIDEYRHTQEHDARQGLSALKLQVGYGGGRVYYSEKDGKPGKWIVQTIHEDEPTYQDGMIDGVQRVLILPCQFRTFGIVTESTGQAN